MGNAVNAFFVPHMMVLSFIVTTAAFEAHGKVGTSIHSYKLAVHSAVRMGLQVKTIKPAPPGAAIPKTGDLVQAHWTGTLPSGKVYGTSRGGFGPIQKPPFVFRLGAKEVIRAWELGVTKMRVGETAIITATSDICYGKEGSGPVPPNTDLTFEVEVLGLDSRSVKAFIEAGSKPMWSK